MAYDQNRAAEYRREAARYLEVACRVSLRDDREHALEMVDHLLALAEEAEAEERR